MEQADVDDKIIITTTRNPNLAPEVQESIIKIESNIEILTKQQVSEALKKAEATIKPKTVRPKRKTKSQGKKRK
jgi:hypothetical protein